MAENFAKPDELRELGLTSFTWTIGGPNYDLEPCGSGSAGATNITVDGFPVALQRFGGAGRSRRVPPFFGADYFADAVIRLKMPREVSNIGSTTRTSAAAAR